MPLPRSPVDRDTLVAAAATAASRIPGYMRLGELTWLAKAALDATVIVEIGSWKGRSTTALAYIAQHTGAQVFAIDHWAGQLRDPASAPTREIAVKYGGNGDLVYEEFCQNLRGYLSAGVVIPVKRNSQDGYPAELNPHMIDLLFIDGDHSYIGCKTDIDLYAPRVRKGGVIAGHDYNTQPRHIGVRQIVDEYWGGVRKLCHSIWWVKK